MKKEEYNKELQELKEEINNIKSEQFSLHCKSHECLICGRTLNY